MSNAYDDDDDNDGVSDSDDALPIDPTEHFDTDSDGIVKIWDIRMVQELLTVDVGDTIAHCVAFDKKTKILAVGCSDGEVRIINMEKQ